MTGDDRCPATGHPLSVKRYNLVTMNDVPRILDQIGQSEPTAAEELLPLVYHELRKLAAGHLANEAPGHTLDPTALVHEAYLRLVGPLGDRSFANRGHFFASAADAMRHILVDSARRKQALKRGADPRRLPFDPDRLMAPVTEPDSWIDLDEVLTAFEKVDTEAAELAKLRIFGGLSGGKPVRLWACRGQLPSASGPMPGRG